MFADAVKLIYTTKTQDADGFEVDTETPYETYANKKSVTRSEFYSSMQAGIKPLFTLDIRKEEWEETRHIVSGKAMYADKVEYDGYVYDIIRSFEKGNYTIELTCG